MEINGDVTDAGRTDGRTIEHGKIVLLSQWKLEAEFRNLFQMKAWGEPELATAIETNKNSATERHTCQDIFYLVGKNIG